MAHKRLSARTITRSAGPKGTVEEFFYAFIELFYCQSPGGGFVGTARTRNIVTRVMFSKGTHVGVIIGMVVDTVEIRRGGTITDISEECG